VRYEFSGVLDYVLVVWSNLDRVLPVWQAHEAVARLRRGCLALIPACGHLPQVEHPRRFAAELGELLAGQDS
jgi:pimeloyl-ACP methyl ester carboxylesterase